MYAQLRLSMPEMQEEIYCHPQHRRARCWEGEMPKMWREKTGATHYRFSGKNLQKELVIRTDSKCQKHYVRLCPVILSLFQNLSTRDPETSSG